MAMPRYKAFLRQGDTLLEIARNKQDDEADSLYEAACAAYLKVLQLRPGTSEALVGLGCGRLALATRASDSEMRQALLAEARKALLAAETLAAKAASYNLACLCALEGDPQGCHRWLQRAKKRLQLPAVEQLLADPDLASFRGEAWFAELVR
jgi:hypothetical protein